jgi:hypothetical protein
MMHKTSVSAYAQEMFQDRIYGESIMVIALCLSLEISITVYQKDSKKLETCEYIPTFNYQQHVEIFLDLNRKHYECILPTASHDLHFSSSSSAQTGFPKNNSTMTSDLNSAASLTVKKNNRKLSNLLQIPTLNSKRLLPPLLQNFSRLKPLERLLPRRRTRSVHMRKSK